MTVRTNNEMMPSYTVISNDFIDNYMASANGEYVKVYLYVLRAGGDVTCDEIADALEMTATDAARAVNYWSRKGLLSMCEDAADAAAPVSGAEASQAVGVVRSAEASQTAGAVRSAETAQAAGAVRSAETAQTAGAVDVADIVQAAEAESGAGDRQTAAGRDADISRIAADGNVTAVPRSDMSDSSAYTTGAAEDKSETGAGGREQNSGRDAGSAGINLEKLQDDEEFAGLLYCLQRYMGRTFGQKDIESLGYMYDGLHMSSDMIEYLAEVCVKRGRTSSRYMEAIARDWAGKGITTVEAARAETSQYGSQVWTVMRAFGLNDRKPAQVELEYVERWFGSYSMSEDMVKEAISRTMGTIHKPSFEYADSILEKWHTAGVHRVEEISALDKEHEKRSRSQAAGTYVKPRTTGFSNFEQRDTDLDSGMLAMLKDKL